MPAIVLSACNEWLDANGNLALVKPGNISATDNRLAANEWHDSDVLTPPRSPTPETRQWIEGTTGMSLNQSS
jgi:hypothetical protein